jgi:hypothetical protein
MIVKVDVVERGCCIFEVIVCYAAEDDLPDLWWEGTSRGHDEL